MNYVQKVKKFWVTFFTGIHWDQWTVILFWIETEDIADPHLDLLVKFRLIENDVIDNSCQNFYDMKIAKNCREFAITKRVIYSFLFF